MPAVTIARGFVVAMHATVAGGAQDAPHALVPEGTIWVIVSRWGDAGEYLTLGWAGAAAADAERAPPGLAPAWTAFGRLVDAATPCFLLSTELPATLPVGGRFFGTEGFVRLRQVGASLRLEGVGRGLGEGPGGSARAWRLAARRRPWIGEVLRC